MSSGMLTTARGRRLAVALTVVVTVMLAGCAGGTVGQTMNQQQAEARAEQIVRDTAAALHPRPRLDFDPSIGNRSGPCLAEHLPDTMVQPERRAWLRGVPNGQQINIANQVKVYWQKQGYVITSTANFDKGFPAISGYTPDRDPFKVFTFSLGTASNGWVFIGAEAPCVWPNGTPPPGN